MNSYNVYTTTDIQMMNPIAVTVVIPVKNEEKNLPHCLELLKEFSEVIVVDSNSTDRTPEIVKRYGRKLVNFNWNGQFPKKRNWTLRNVPIQNEWVLFLDADEYVTEKFKEELAEAINRNGYVGFWVHYINDFMGKVLKYGAVMPKLPLFKVGAGEYEFIDEKQWSHLDMEIHEHPILNGKIGEIKSPVIHREFRGLAHYIQKHNEYSSWEANRYLKMKDKKGELTFRQKIKYTFIDTWLLGIMYFCYSYFYKLGFLDGKIGFIYAAYKMQYFFNIKAKIEEIRINQKFHHNSTKHR